MSVFFSVLKVCSVYSYNIIYILFSVPYAPSFNETKTTNRSIRVRFFPQSSTGVKGYKLRFMSEDRSRCIEGVTFNIPGKTLPTGTDVSFWLRFFDIIQ